MDSPEAASSVDRLSPRYISDPVLKLIRRWRLPMDPVRASSGGLFHQQALSIPRGLF